MPYLGRQPSIGRFAKIDDITSQFNSSQTVFSLTSSSVAIAPGAPSNMIVSLGGVVQEPESAYTVSGSTITFASAPANTQSFFGVVLGDVLDVGTLTPGININVSSIGIGSNVTMNTSTVLIGNSSVNTAVTSGGVTVNGNSPWLSQTFRGLTLRTHPDADVSTSKVYLDRADEIVMNTGVRIADWDDLAADITVSGAGGLDTGSEAASTWYEIHAIRKSSDGTKNLLLHRAKNYGADQSSTTVDSTVNVRRTSAVTRTKLAQGIQFTNAGPVSFVDIQIIKTGSPTGRIWLTIEANSSGDPSGTALATSDKIDVSLVSTSAQWVRFVFRTPYTVSAATQYHLVLQGDYTTSDDVNNIGWKCNSSSVYANGHARELDSGTWAGVGGGTTYDFAFKLYVTQNDTTVTMPSGYDQRCLVGYVYNDSGSNFQGFSQLNRTVEVQSTSANYATGFSTGTFTTTAAVLFSLDAIIPPIPIEVRLNGANDTVGAYVVVSGRLPSGAFPRGQGAQYLYSSVASATNPSFTFQPLFLEFQHLYAFVGSGTGRLYIDGWEW